MEMKEAICPICKKIYKYPPGFEKQTCGIFDCVYRMALIKLKIKESEVVNIPTGEEPGC